MISKKVKKIWINLLAEKIVSGLIFPFTKNFSQINMYYCLYCINMLIDQSLKKRSKEKYTFYKYILSHYSFMIYNMIQFI